MNRVEKVRELVRQLDETLLDLKDRPPHDELDDEDEADRVWADVSQARNAVSLIPWSLRRPE